jgi:hypothetical protein
MLHHISPNIIAFTLVVSGDDVRKLCPSWDNEEVMRFLKWYGDRLTTINSWSLKDFTDLYRMEIRNEYDLQERMPEL